MRTRYNGIARAVLLTAALFLAAAGCAAERSASAAPEIVSSQTSGSDLLSQAPGEKEDGEAVLALAGGSQIELVRDLAIEDGEEPVLTVTLTGLEFVQEPEKEQFQLENLPAGLDFAVEPVDGVTARIRLSGTPTEDVEKADLTLFLKRSLFLAAEPEEAPDGGMGLNEIAEDEWITAKGIVSVFVRPSRFAELTGEEIDLPVGEAIKEGEEHILIVTLTGLEFSDALNREQFRLENLPAGLDFTVEPVDSGTVKLLLSGTPAGKPEGAVLTLSLKTDLFDVPGDEESEDGEPENVLNPEEDWIDALGSVPISVFERGAELTGGPIDLTAGNAVKEGEEPVLTVTLTGLEFAETLDEAQFRLEGLPAGLTFAVSRTSGRAARLLLSGTPAEAVEEARLSLTIGKDQLQPPPEQDLSVDGDVIMVIAAGSGLPVSPVVLAVCGVAAVVVIAAAAAVVSSRKKNTGKARNISGTESIRRKSGGQDMPGHQGKQDTASAASVGARVEGTVQIGKLHNIGRRSGQQDSLGSMSLDDGAGVFAVVADGMGGLSGGDQVSQSVVMSMLQQAGALGPGQMDGALSAMVRGANAEVNRKLGPDGIYRSGSTVVAVLLRGNAFHWISVGDSRVYLYRGGSMIQLNQEHTYEVELMQRVMNGEITAAEAASDPQRRGLTSFIGMGRLKYVDASLRPIVLQDGDRVLLMTDGVFNNLPESAMADTLGRYPDVQQAAKVLEEQVIALQDAAQDNFTAIILGFQG